MGAPPGGGPGQKAEVFLGYYLQLAAMVAEEGGHAVPEIGRRMELSSCRVDPQATFSGVLERMVRSGITLSDLLCDSGYAYRIAEHFALRLRRIGVSLVMDLHPHDRGPQGTHEGAVVSNAILYCPATPRALLELGPAARDAGGEALAAHDQLTTELDRHRLRRISADDCDGYHRVTCPALSGKVRCPLRSDSLALAHDRPTVLSPPEHPPVCCHQQTITVPPTVAAKTAQKHPYPSVAWRCSYDRRSAAERSNSRIKDPATVDVSKGCCRAMGLVPTSVFLVCAIVVRNLAVTDAFEKRQDDNARRVAAGRPPRTRRRRRTTIGDLLVGAGAPP